MTEKLISITLYPVKLMTVLPLIVIRFSQIITLAVPIQNLPNVSKQYCNIFSG